MKRDKDPPHLGNGRLPQMHPQIPVPVTRIPDEDHIQPRTTRTIVRRQVGSVPAAPANLHHDAAHATTSTGPHPHWADKRGTTRTDRRPDAHASSRSSAPHAHSTSPPTAVARSSRSTQPSAPGSDTSPPRTRPRTIRPSEAAPSCYCTPSPTHIHGGTQCRSPTRRA